VSNNRPADIVKCLVVIGGKEGLRQYEGPCVMIGSLWERRTGYCSDQTSHHRLVEDMTSAESCYTLSRD